MALINGNGVKKEAQVNSMTLDNFLQSVFDQSLKEVMKKGKDRNEPVVVFKKPEELKKILNLKINQNPLNHEELLKQCSDFLKYSVKTGMTLPINTFLDFMSCFT